MFERIKELIEYHNNSPAPLHLLDRNGIDILPKQNPVGDLNYSGSPRTPLPLELNGRGHPYRSLYTGAWNAETMTLHSLSLFLRHGMGISGWLVDDRGEQVKRTFHSIDSVYPIEAYVINYGSIQSLEPGLYHFYAKDHELSLRAKFNETMCKELELRFGENTSLLGLSHQAWRHTMVSHERGWRNTQLDHGHVVTSLQLSAATQGWEMNWLQSMDQQDMNLLLGLFQDENQTKIEFASSLWTLRSKGAVSFQNLKEVAWRKSFERLEYHGQAQQVDYQQSSADVIQNLQSWCEWPGEVYPNYIAPIRGNDERWLHPSFRSEKILRSYRPAELFDPNASLSREDFFAILDKTLSRSERYPFSGFSVSPKVHLLLFVHRVQDLERGLYLLSRDESANAMLKSQLAGDFEWKPQGGPVNFYRLQLGDFRHVTTTLWNQSELGESAIFHTMMIADFDKSVRLDLSTYPHIFWESGMIAQVLATEATALEHRTQHLAHFIDEQCHLLMGMRSDQFRSTYLSCFGKPTQSDAVFKPAYHHLS